MKSGELNELVQASVTGALLASMLLLPGLSMIAGGFKRKTMHFNPVAAGVSSVLLIVCIIGAFSPTIFYQVYGNYNLHCDNCTAVFYNDTKHELQCEGCQYNQTNLDQDPAYTDGARPLMYVCAAFLPLAYISGLLFTLKTHASIFKAPPQGEDGEPEAEESGHDAPEWSRLTSILVLLIGTTLFALISEDLVQQIQPTLQKFNLSQTFLGVTIIAIVPSAAEFVNAIQFALQENISLALEIGNSAAVQISLIQIPALVLISAILNHGHYANSFTLIFPVMNVFAVIFAVIILNYLSIDGKSNYFQGSALCIIWAILIASFYFEPHQA